MANWRLDRQTLVVALGGGVVTDLAGFVSACYMRGVDYISIPTTLMAMIDASIGGKTGVNLLASKNLIGSFYSPQFILIDPSFLKTLAEREFSAGLAEMIKYGIIGSCDLFEKLERQIESLFSGDSSLLLPFIHRCCQIKCDIVKQDPKDNGVRAYLNYGHTFAHALEGLTRYERYLHGEAVSIGMSCAMRVSCQMNQVDKETADRQDNLCLRAKLPIQLPDSICVEALIESMKGDKKSIAGKINLILPQKIGKVSKFLDVDPAWIKKTLIK